MMKIKPLLIGLGLGVTILSGCSDDLNLVGSTIQPDGDKMPVYVDTFQMQATTLLMDSVYARTTNGLLGEFYDPLYGNVKSDYICQFYCPDDFKFKHEPINGQIDSIDFKIMYQNGAWVGDSLAPMRAQIYLVDKELERDFIRTSIRWSIVTCRIHWACKHILHMIILYLTVFVMPLILMVIALLFRLLQSGCLRSLVRSSMMNQSKIQVLSAARRTLINSSPDCI